LNLAQYRELASFAQFGTADLDAATRAQLARGQLATEVLKQLQYHPLNLEQEVIILYAVNAGLMDDIPMERCAAFEEQLLRYMGSTHPDVGRAVADSKDITEDTGNSLNQAITEFKGTFSSQL
jgi:F-type H+-transporting ATPase subunit alpha